jgi:hypothetical protein
MRVTAPEVLRVLAVNSFNPDDRVILKDELTRLSFPFWAEFIGAPVKDFCGYVGGDFLGVFGEGSKEEDARPLVLKRELEGLVDKKVRFAQTPAAQHHKLAAGGLFYCF